jgi:copper resistance protein D
MDAPLALVLSRWCFFSAAAILFGSSLFRLYGPSGAQFVGAWPYKIAARALSAVAFVAAAAWLLALSHSLDAQNNLFATSWTVLTQTTFGPDWAARLAFAAIAVVAAAFDTRLIVFVSSAMLLICEGGDGHAAAHGWFGEAVQAVHVLAAGAWIGGLFPLTSTLFSAQRSDAPAATFATVRRFSSIAIAAVVAILATGVVNVLLLKPALVLTSLYARVLGLKLTLVTAMIALAIFNRVHLTRRLNTPSGREAMRALIRTAVCEGALGFTILAAVAWLGLLDPYNPHM